jgi:CHAT domain-containing protein
VEARDSAESLKSAELEDYFQDECVSLLRQKTTRVEELSPEAAVIYIIPLEDRTETLVTVGRKIHRIRSAVPGAQITAAAERLRRTLEDRTSNEYLEPAKQLHDWLIAPLESLLAQARPTTLVFVPDGALRTIPMAALHDGKQFLIQRFALAVTPGLTLLETAPPSREKVEILLTGLSEARQDFPALPFVPQEIASVQKIYGGNPLLNRDFILPRVKSEFAARPFSIMHIASHGHFDRDVAKTFLLTFGEKLTLDDLERLLQPARLRDQPVDLLSLSACQTAAGDDRAALGLAGIAIKAGARSAFATLWCVNDEASARLVVDFYQELQRAPHQNKAQALRAAQLRLLSDPRSEHPCYWAPYLIIGNWL